MIYLIIGLLLFFSVHSVRILTDGWRSKFIEDKGKLKWRGFYTLRPLRFCFASTLNWRADILTNQHKYFNIFPQCNFSLSN
jgi:uncharacterized membrane protein